MLFIIVIKYRCYNGSAKPFPYAFSIEAMRCGWSSWFR